MELDRLSDFAAVARLGSIKAAARERGVSDATLAARIKKLEEQLGTRLFEKNGQTMALTSSGEMLLSDAEQILTSYRQLRRELNAAPCIWGLSWIGSI